MTSFTRNYERLAQVNAYVTYFNGDRFPKEPVSASLTEVLKRPRTRNRGIDKNYKPGTYLHFW